MRRKEGRIALLRGAQVYACPDNKCGRNFAHDDGFRHKTYTGEHVTTPGATRPARR